jgi:MFS family permease
MPDKAPFRSKLFPAQLNVQTLITYNVLQGTYNGYIQVFWQPFLLTLGIPVATIGLLEALSGRSGALASLVQVFGGRLSDRGGRRRLVLLGSGFLICCWSVATLAFLLKTPALVFVVYVLWSLSVMALPVLDAALADSISVHERSRIYSIVLLANVLPSAATGYLAGKIIPVTGPTPLLGLAALLETGGFLLLYKRLTNVQLSPVEAAAERESSNIRQVTRDAIKYWRYFSVFSADSLAWAVGMSIFPALLKAAKGYTSGDFGLIATTIPLGTAFGTLPGGWLTNRIGAKNLLLTSECLGALIWLGWGFFPAVEVAPIYGFVWGTAISTWLPVQFQVLTDVFPAERRGELLGAVATFRGLIATLGPVIATLLYLRLGYSAPFAGAVAGILITIVLIVKFIPAKRDVEKSGERTETPLLHTNQ